tara:strand:- start:1063 stop:1938 length:876 start_codon:yes stop_codon:yes gene_type:complete
MSTLKADAVTGQTTNGNLGLTGNGTGKVTIGDGTLIFPDADGSANQPIITNGSAALSFATLPIAGGGTGSTSTTYCNLTSNVTGTLPVANGGTGATTLTSNYVLLGNGSSAPQMIAPGSDGNVLTSDGSTWASEAAGGGITLGTDTASTSGTTVDFTSIPAGTKRITVTLEDVSTNGTSNLLVQIGDSGGIETSGYVATGVNWPSGSYVNSTVGFCTRQNAASNVFNGAFTLSLKDASNFTWVGTCMGRQQPNYCFAGGGTKSLSAELDRVRLTTESANTFDAGSVNIMYE